MPTISQETAMFTTLPESRAARTRRPGGALASLLVHGALAAGAVSLTMTGTAGARPAPDRPVRDTIIFLVRPARAATRRPPGAGVRTAAPSPPRHDRPDVGLLPPVVGPELPEPDFVSRPDPDVGIGGHVPTEGVLGGSGALGAGEGVVGERDVDRAPCVVGSPTGPRYPDALRAAGITGRVLARFVVDTLGRAEPESLEPLEATRPEFADAVRGALPRYRFTPGEVGGRKVRTRVQMPFTFTLR